MVSHEDYYSQKMYEATCQNNILAVNKILENNNVNVNYIQPDFKISSLHVACIESNFDIIHLLIENNANLLITDDHDITPIDMLKEKLHEYHKTYPKCKYIFDKTYFKTCEDQNKVLNFLNDFMYKKPTVIKVDMSIIYCSTDKNYCYPAIEVSPSHKYKTLWNSYGSCEWQIRSTSVGAAVDTIISKTVDEDVIFESNEDRIGNNDFKESKKKMKFGEQPFIYPNNRYIATLHPGYAYIMRVRYVNLSYKNIKTKWSDWSESIMYPKQTFVKWLRSYGLENFIGWLGKLNIYELKDLQVLSRQSLESGLRKSGMDFRERRLLWQAVQSTIKKINKPNNLLINNGESVANYSTCIIKKESDAGPYTQLYIFLKDIGLEHYHDDIEIFVDTLDILIEAYSNQDELIEDIKEVIPEMKPAHRRLLWKGIEKFKFK